MAAPRITRDVSTSNVAEQACDFAGDVRAAFSDIRDEVLDIIVPWMVCELYTDRPDLFSPLDETALLRLADRWVGPKGPLAAILHIIMHWPPIGDYDEGPDPEDTIQEDREPEPVDWEDYH